MGSKILYFWGVVSFLFLTWDSFLGPLFGIYFEDLAKSFLLLTIAIFSFALAYLVHTKES